MMYNRPMTPTKKRILVSGSLAFDLLLTHEGSFLDALDASALHHLSVCYNTPHYGRGFGGNAGSTGRAFSLLGQRPDILSAVGADAGDYLAFFEKETMETDGIARHADCNTATCIIGTDNHGHQITFFHDGANAKRVWPDMTELSLTLACAIIAPTEPPLTLEGLRSCKKHNVPCFFDPGQRVPQFTQQQLWEAIELSSGVFINAYEAELLTHRLETTAEKIAKRTPFLVVTRDADGFILYEGGRSVGLPRCNADTVVDPTGAGDAFRAGFITGLLQQWPHEHCGQLGAAVASVSVEHRGVILPSLDMDAVYARAEKAYGQPLPRL